MLQSSPDPDAEDGGSVAEQPRSGQVRAAGEQLSPDLDSQGGA